MYIVSVGHEHDVHACTQPQRRSGLDSKVYIKVRGIMPHPGLEPLQLYRILPDQEELH